MKAIIIGATGATGKQVVKQLLDDETYTEVMVLVRRKYFDYNPKLTEVVVEFDKLENYKDLIFGDVAFSCLGTTCKQAGSKQAQWKIDFEYQYQFAKLCLLNKVKKFVLVSSVGANPNSFVFYSQLKGSLEQAIKKLPFSCILIFQPPSLIRPETNRFGENFAVKVLHFFNSLGLFKNYEPLHVSNLAKSMQQSVLKYNSGIHTFTLNSIKLLITSVK